MSKKTFKKSIASIFIAVVLIVSLIPLSNLPGVGTQTYGSDENIEFKVSPQKDSYSAGEVVSVTATYKNIDASDAEKKFSINLEYSKGDLELTSGAESQSVQLKGGSSETFEYKFKVKKTTAKLSDKIKIKVAESTGSAGFRSRGRVAGTRASSGTSRATVSTADILEHNKRIDYLGDGVTNSDTTVAQNHKNDVKDLYRIYVDVTGKEIKKQPFDILFVVDRSSSMEEKDMYSTRSNSYISRDGAVSEMLNGSQTSYTGRGLIPELLDLNPENQIAVISFGGDRKHTVNKQDAQIDRDWGRNKSFVNTKAFYWNGTNYTAGLEVATDMFNKPAVKNNGHRKLMVFISDGVPTFYVDNSGVRHGDGGINWAPYAKEPTRQKIDEFIADHKDVMIHTIGVSKDINGTTSSSSPELLQHMAKKGGGEYIGVFDNANLYEEVKKLLEANMVNVLNVTDELSDSVELYAAQSDVKVTRKEKSTGIEKVLYENGNSTADNWNNGHRIIESVTYTPSSSPDSTGKMFLQFHEDEKVDSKFVYTLSYNVKVTPKAYEKYENGGYTSTGDTDTDYGSNDTSSGKPGFRSNKSARINYEFQDEKIEEEYKHPVVQVADSKLVLEKTDNTGEAQLKGAKFDIYKVSSQGTAGAVKLPDTTDKWGIPFKSNLVVDKKIELTAPIGEYYIVEKEAPEGYSIIPEPIKVKVRRDTVAVVTGASWTETEAADDSTGTPMKLRIKDNPLYELPKAGGIGTYLFYLSGAFCMTAATIFYRRRRSEA